MVDAPILSMVLFDLIHQYNPKRTLQFKVGFVLFYVWVGFDLEFLAYIKWVGSIELRLLLLFYHPTKPGPDQTQIEALQPANLT